MTARIRPSSCFDPRPRVEGDRPADRPVARRESFDPRPRVEGDHRHRVESARGRCFDPRPRVEGDSSGALYRRDRYCFDPRPRVEGDIPPEAPTASRRCFDPRPRVEGDRAGVGRCGRSHVSIRAPAWRATLAASAALPWSMFRSAPPRGGRPGSRGTMDERQRFDPRPRVEGDS